MIISIYRIGVPHIFGHIPLTNFRTISQTPAEVPVFPASMLLGHATPPPDVPTRAVMFQPLLW